uniref:Uncharacterized protein n=1 Tax=Eptatretus burgeri TaxID=7764 RepID=A0A8C4R352_EPTBU
MNVNLIKQVALDVHFFVTLSLTKSYPPFRKFHLSGNLLSCDCDLVWLHLNPTINLVNKADTTCAFPISHLNSSLMNVTFTDSMTVACANISSFNKSWIFHSSAQELGVYSQRSCNAICYSKGRRFYSLDVSRHCRCYNKQLIGPANVSELSCKPTCDLLWSDQHCGNIFPVRLEMTLKGLRPFSIHEVVTITALPWSHIVHLYEWDFGDGSPLVREQWAHHKYGLPGRYTVTLQITAGTERVKRRANVTIFLVPGVHAQLECPASGRLGQHLHFWVNVEQGNNLEAQWSFRPNAFCPAGGWIFQENGHCYWPVLKHLSWKEARAMCRQTPLADLTSIDGENEQNFLMSHLNRLSLFNFPGLTISHDFWATHIKMLPSNYHCIVVFFTAEINITVNVSDGHGQLSKTTEISVQAPIAIVNIDGPSNGVMVGKPEVFTAVVIPPSSPVMYTWNFNTSIHREVNLISHSVEYIFSSSGQYTVSVVAQNGISSGEAGISVSVCEAISGLVLDSTGPDELGTPSFLSARVQTGEPVNWTFIMDDGCVYANRSNSKVAHIYETEGNYTVTVVTVNPVSSQNTSQIVRVYELRVIGISLAECVPTKCTISLHVKTSGDAGKLVYLWDFNDGTSPVSVHGSPLIEHMFTTGGNFSGTLKVSSNYSEVFFSFLVCAEEMINYISLTPRSPVATVAVEVEFVVQVYPPASERQQYKYVWDFGTERPRSCLGSKASYSYNDSGTFMVVVSVSNNVDRKNASVLVVVQDKVEMLDLIIANCSAEQISINKSCLFMAKASGTNVTFTWDFGDGSELMQDQAIYYNFSLSGVFPINCSAANAVSSTWAILEVTVLSHLTSLKISANVVIAEVNVSVTFFAFLPTNESVSYQWAMCEGCPFLPGSAIYTHTFLLSETYAVMCLAYNAISTAKAKMNLTVAEKIAGLQLKIFILTDDRCCETGLPLTASASVVKGSNIEYIWTVFQIFSILEVLEGPEVNISLRESGSYIIAVLARNGLGEEFTNKSIEALDRIDEINLIISPDPITLGKNVTFQAKHSFGTDVVYTWQAAKHEVPIETSFPSFMHVYDMPREEVASVVASNMLGNVSDSKNVTIYEAVEGLQIVTQSFVATGNYTKLQGCVKHGSSIMWVWVIPTYPGSQLYYEKEIFHRFVTAAVYQVLLNASNPVSTQVDVFDIVVQDEVQGFQLVADKLEAEPQEEVTFVMTVAGGSSVEYTIYLSVFTIVKISGMNYTHSFSQVGIHNVLAVASNMVSSDTNTTTVKILRKIVGLEILNCCSEVLQSGTAKEFIALIAAGSNVTFCWTFKFPGHPVKVLEGSSVVFTAGTHGNLTIILNASNSLGHVQLNELVIVQQAITGASLDCNVTSPAFVGESIKFQVLLQSGSDMQYDWYFGDNSTMIAQSLPFVVHTYTAPGDYKVFVQICNALSCATKEMLLSVTLGGCRSPIVQLVAPRSSVPTALPNVFEALVDFGGCEARHHATYHWQVWKAPSCIGMNAATLWSLPVSVDVHRPQLWLPARALPIGDICLAFTSALKDTLLTQTLYLNVTVKASHLVAVIVGGMYRTLGLHEPLELDARKSYDPDVSSAKMPNLSGMEFIWTISVMGGYNIPLKTHGVNQILSRRLDKRHLIVLPFVPEVSVANVSVPSVLVECASCETLGSFVTGRSHHVTLLGTCTSCDAHYFNQPFPLNITTTSTGASGAALVVRKGVLSNGLSYIFTLTVSGLGVEPGSSSIVLPPNEPPGGGSCELHKPLSLTGSQRQESKITADIQFAIRRNITLVLTSLRASTLTDVWQTATALSAASVSLIQRLIFSLTVRCVVIAHVQTAVSTRAYTLANRLLQALMASRVLDEETLIFHVPALNAEARRVSPLSLLCAIARRNISVDSTMPGCHFSIPTAAVKTIAIEMGFPSNQSSLVQTLLFFDVNPFPSGSHVDFPITTNVASLELYRPDGFPIEVLGLSLDAAISVTLSGEWRTLRPASGTWDRTDSGQTLAPVPSSASLLHSATRPSTSTPSSVPFAVRSLLNDTTQPYYVDIKNCYADVTINVSVLVYLVLCQYYDQESLQWRTEGMVPTMGTSPYQAVCLTQHLSVFGATLFHPHGAVIIIPPARSLVVAITCAVLGILYVFSAMIAWKMDIIDVARVGLVPLCSPDGCYKYEVTVKTGWTLSAGTTAHVGICLYGQACSGPRHLVLPGAFQRNNLDIFHIASDTVIGSIWKIHIWHDNTGLHPSWFLQHVLVRDLCTNKMYFFLVNDWLSVDNSHTDGVVKKEVLAASKCELNAFRRLFPALVQHGLFAQHAWLSILERPARSRFTRLQRVSDCALLLAIPLCSSAIWYGGLTLKNDRYSCLLCLFPSLSAVADTRRKAPLPYGCIYAAHAFNLLVLVTCFFMAAFYGLAFSPTVALMWLISCAISFLTSFFALEPLKVLGIALYQALLVRPLDPYVDRGLVEEPLVVPSQDTACKVRAPLGYGLLQAKVEASKLRSLHRLLRVTHAYYLSSLFVSILPASSRLITLSSLSCILWQWLGDVLLMEIYDSPSTMQGMKIVLGTPRLRQIRSAPGELYSVTPTLDSGKVYLEIFSLIFMFCMLLCGRTRAVFVEYVQWVPAVGLHSVVTVLVEFPPVGGAVQNLHVWPFLLHRFDEPDISLVLMVGRISDVHCHDAFCYKTMFFLHQQHVPLFGESFHIEKQNITWPDKHKDCFNVPGSMSSTSSHPGNQSNELLLREVHDCTLSTFFHHEGQVNVVSGMLTLMLNHMISAATAAG